MLNCWVREGSDGEGGCIGVRCSVRTGRNDEKSIVHGECMEN